MTMLQTIHLTCPNCASEFDSSRVDTYDTRGRKHTDFQFDSRGSSTLPYGVHLCESCGFAGPEKWFAEADGISYEVQRHVWDELAPRVSNHLAASERYEFAAKVAIWDGADLRNVADLWLRAAWCCVDEGDIEAERFYRRQAAWTFEECLDSYDRVPNDERATLAYLVGELWRRIGDQARANEWFERVANEVVDGYRQNWLLRLAKQQHDDPREWFA